ncbi:MAG: hypothetical protein MSH60_05045 [Ruminococcus sp.]|nr:hypothetical protein [Ruminococcus sp.]
MKMNKAIAALVSGAVAVSGMAVSAFALDTPVVAKLGFTDSTWEHQDWETSVEVTGDGTYTLTSDVVAGAADFGVFVIDFDQMFANYPDAVATLDKIEVDGSEISVSADKILYGDIEEKGNFRIDIYNMYSDTKDDPGVNQATAVAESLSVTFTVSGLEAAAPAETEAAPAETEAAPAETEAASADTAETTAPATGNASAAAIVAVMAVAGAAAVISKKRG